MIATVVAMNAVEVEMTVVAVALGRRNEPRQTRRWQVPRSLRGRGVWSHQSSRLLDELWQLMQSGIGGLATAGTGSFMAARGHNVELFQQMQETFEKAIKQAEGAGREARQATDERQKTLDELKKKTEENQQQLKDIITEQRKASRAASAPAQSRRLRQDLAAGVHPRRAKEMDKARERAATHRVEQRKERQANWKSFEREPVDDNEKWDRGDMGDEPELPKPRRVGQRKRRAGVHKSDKKRKAAKKEEEEKKKLPRQPRRSLPSRPARPRPPFSRSSDDDHPGMQQQFFNESHDEVEETSSILISIGRGSPTDDEQSSH